MHRDPPKHIHDQRLYHIYHRGDVAKLEILLQYGGIYLDYDVIVVNSLDPVRRYDATLGEWLTYLVVALTVVWPKDFKRCLNVAVYSTRWPEKVKAHCLTRRIFKNPDRFVALRSVSVSGVTGYRGTGYCPPSSYTSVAVGSGIGW